VTRAVPPTAGARLLADLAALGLAETLADLAT
jgi:hypothetical protein